MPATEVAGVEVEMVAGAREAVARVDAAMGVSRAVAARALARAVEAMAVTARRRRRGC